MTFSDPRWISDRGRQKELARSPIRCHRLWDARGQARADVDEVNNVWTRRRSGQVVRLRGASWFDSVILFLFPFSSFLFVRALSSPVVRCFHVCPLKISTRLVGSSIRRGFRKDDDSSDEKVGLYVLNCRFPALLHCTASTGPASVLVAALSLLLMSVRIRPGIDHHEFLHAQSIC